ncbi:MAG TPA: hypothetical protein VGK45_06720 [Thermoanaerobaculia bacterium]
MAEPIRKIALPVHRRPQGARPHPRPRPLRTAAPEPRPMPQTPPMPPMPVPVLPEESATTEVVRERSSQTFQPIPRKKLRQILQTALGLHLAAVVLLFLFPSAGQPSGLSDILLTAAVLAAGGTMLAVSSFSRRSGKL